jgi:2-C-methyl-D-erythritol 4-phosphate cytidylyltransferase
MREIGPIVVVVPLREIGRTNRMLQRAGCRKVVAVVPGGRDRQASVHAGLRSFPVAPKFVLVQDAVRPFTSARTISAVIAAVRKHGAAIAAARITDTVKEEFRGSIARTVPREALWGAQTPQGFRYDLLLLAHRVAGKLRFRGTDESSLLERLGIAVRIVESEKGNGKITTPDDLRIAEIRLKRRGG